MSSHLEGRAGPRTLTRVLVRMYAVNRLRGLTMWLVRRLEGPEFTSSTVREIFATHFDVHIGMYSHGACFEPFTIDQQTTIGRYCSFARGSRIINHNHPGDFKSTSGIFFNPHFGLCQHSLVEFNPLVVGNDVWVGSNAVILPEVNRIGDGAIIGAGAVVNRDVPPYAVVLGNPGRVVKYRFDQETIARLLQERWWEKDLAELAPSAGEFQVPYRTSDAQRSGPLAGSSEEESGPAGR